MRDLKLVVKMGLLNNVDGNCRKGKGFFLKDIIRIICIGVVCVILFFDVCWVLLFSD